VRGSATASTQKRGVVAEADSYRCAAVGGDRDPHLVATRADTELLQGPGPRRLDDDVGPCNQPSQGLHLRGVVEVEGDTLLPAVEEVEERRRTAARTVRPPRRLDLYYTGAGQLQQVAAQRPRPQGGEVHDERVCDRLPWTATNRSVGDGRSGRAEGGDRQAQQPGPLGEQLGGSLRDVAGDHVPHVVCWWGFEPGGDGVDVVGAGKRHRQPAVGRGEEARRPTAAAITTAGQARDGRPLGEHGEQIEVDAPARR
jgi:hypothetical protein